MSSSNLIAGVEAWLAEREAKCAAATPGLHHECPAGWTEAVSMFTDMDTPSHGYLPLADAEFYADARTLAPGTITYGKQLVEALRKAEAEQAAGNWYGIHAGTVDTLRAQLAAFAEAHQITAAQQEDSDAGE